MRLPWRPAWPTPPIPTSLTVPETQELRRLGLRYPRVLEIGAAYGYSTVVLALHAQHVVSVDPHAAHDSYERCRANLISYGVENKVTLHRCTSLQFSNTAPQGPYDLIFIDGDHTREWVLHDAALADEVIAKAGGAVAFHDYGEESCPDVKPLLDRLYPEGPTRLVDTLFVVER